MTQPTALTTVQLNDQQRAIFYSQMAMVQKDEVVGVLLALFFGSFGLHHFYLRRPGLGILYLLFCWTGIPAILGFLECFFMPERVRCFNLAQAQYVMASLVAGGYPVFVAPLWTNPACTWCAAPTVYGSRYCPRCGAALVPYAPVG